MASPFQLLALLKVKKTENRLPNKAKQPYYRNEKQPTQ